MSDIQEPLQCSREDQDEHTLPASLPVETLQQKLLEQDKKHKEEEEKLANKIKEQEVELTQKNEVIDHLKSKLQKAQTVVSYFRHLAHEGFVRKFSIDVETVMKNKSTPKSYYFDGPAMYTHYCGFKFRIRVVATRFHGDIVTLKPKVFSLRGNFDDELKFPAEVKFTLELINQPSVENESHIKGFTLHKVKEDTLLGEIGFFSANVLQFGYILVFRVPNVEF